MVDEAKLIAWLDGELPQHEAREVEAQVAADPELARIADEHRAMAARLRDAFDLVAAAPVPAPVRQPLEQNSNVVDLASRRNRAAAPSQSRLPQWTAMAASLALGLFLGSVVLDGSAPSPVESRGGALYAAGPVEAALDAQLASAPGDGAVRIGLTFRDSSGAVCRTFQTSASSGLACRDGGDWQVRGMFAAPEGGASEYRMAAGADPRLMEMVDSAIAGEPFDAQAEAQAKRQGWR